MKQNSKQAKSGGNGRGVGQGLDGHEPTFYRQNRFGGTRGDAVTKQRTSNTLGEVKSTRQGLDGSKSQHAITKIVR